MRDRSVEGTIGLSYCMSKAILTRDLIALQL